MTFDEAGLDTIERLREELGVLTGGEVVAAGLEILDKMLALFEQYPGKGVVIRVTEEGFSVFPEGEGGLTN